MQIFEFYFNPKARQDRFFEIFSLEPPKDSSHGNLYIVGELSHTLPQNAGLLQKFAKVVSQEYSSSPVLKSHDAFFRMLLKGANNFFAQELQKGNVDWLGNLHAALLYVKNSGKKASVMFAKSGGVKVFMTRGTNVVDLAKNLQDSSHGAELFGNIVSLQAFWQDKLVVLTKDISDALVKGNGLSDLSVLLNVKEFQAFFKKQEKTFSRLSGILFAVLVEEFAPQDYKLSLAKFDLAKLSFLRKHILSFKLPRFQLSFAQFLRFPVFKIKTPSLILTHALKQKIILIAALVLVLLGGSLLSQGERKELVRQVQTIVLQVQVIQKEAQDALALSDLRSANILLQEAWKKASLHTDTEVPFRETFMSLQEELERQLVSINSIYRIEEPQVLVDMESAGVDLIPQEMFFGAGNLYFFNPFSSAIFMFDIEEKKGEIISAARNIRYGVPFKGSPLFFAEPNLLFFMESGELEELAIKDVSSFTGMTGFDNNLYFLNSQQGAIVKYEDPLNASSPSPWVSEESLEKPTGARSMTIDGNIWILSKDDMLQRYFGGLWQEDIKPLVFPLLKNAAMVKTFPGNPYLYILDPAESRLILLTKSGDLARQYVIKSHKPLVDFTVSPDGNTLYLLSGSRVFQIPQEELL